MRASYSWLTDGTSTVGWPAPLRMRRKVEVLPAPPGAAGAPPPFEAEELTMMPRAAIPPPRLPSCARAALVLELGRALPPPLPLPFLRARPCLRPPLLPPPALLCGCRDCCCCCLLPPPALGRSGNGGGPECADADFPAVAFLCWCWIAPELGSGRTVGVWLGVSRGRSGRSGRRGGGLVRGVLQGIQPLSCLICRIWRILWVGGEREAGRRPHAFGVHTCPVENIGPYA